MARQFVENNYWKFIKYFEKWGQNEDNQNCSKLQEIRVENSRKHGKHA